MKALDDGSESPLVVFQISEQTCAIPLKCVQEIVPMAQLSQPPGLPHLIEGFLNLGGTSVTVLRLDRLLNLTETSPRLYSMILVLRSGEHPHGLLVDRVSQIIPVSERNLLPIPENDSFNDCVGADVIVDGRVIHLLNVERLLLEQERKAVTEFQAVAQTRLNQLETAAAA